MTLPAQSLSSRHNLQIDNYLPEGGNKTVVKEILEGLGSARKRISSKYFYDATGSKLFKAITCLPEYYPTRTEKPLIKTAADAVCQMFDHTDIVELGSGDCSKISILLEGVCACTPHPPRYIPVDVSQSAIEESAEILASTFPNLAIHGIVADFTTQLERIPNGNKRLYCFFGSTLGNFSREQTSRFLDLLSTTMHPGDRLVLGVDRIKEKQILENAYNDRQGITAAFNRNILNVVNNLAGTDFNPQDFKHLAFYNDVEHRIEMHLTARTDMIVSTPHLTEPLTIEQGERIHTENSYKFSDASITALGDDHGLDIEAVFTDRKKWFSVVQYVKP